MLAATPKPTADTPSEARKPLRVNEVIIEIASKILRVASLK
jgi:hypothetical protein